MGMVKDQNKKTEEEKKRDECAAHHAQDWHPEAKVSVSW